VKVSTQFNRRVPKDIRQNLRWRKAALKRAAKDIEYAQALREACSQDPLFFINAFCWTFDPRLDPFTNVPFVLYDFQETAILELINAIGNHDILVEKSRDMGASWICLAAILWCFLYRPGLSFLLVSRNEDYVDKSGNPKALFWKIDYIIERLPSWLRPVGYDANKHRCKLHMENPENGSVIDGESTTGDVARGDRRTAILLDEFAAVIDGSKVLSATRDATKCRIFNSTPDGTGNAFYRIRETNIRRLRLHWSAHPIKARGLYTTDENKNLKILDPSGYPDDYKPILDGKLRSPWYDNECERAESAREIAQELDIDYQGSGGQYFDPQKVQELILAQSRDPSFVGELEYDFLTGEPIGFRVNPEGNLRIWFLLDGNNDPKIQNEHRVIAGDDISAGTGASNSCSEFYDEATGEKIAEVVSAYLRPEQYAVLIYAVSKWIGNPKHIWENGGPGRQFGSRLIELGWTNYYVKKEGDVPGTGQNKEIKTGMLSAYRAAIESGSCINRSKAALEDALEYVYGPDGHPVHAKSQTKDDPSGAKNNHGDRTMADALAWKLVTSTSYSVPKEEKPKIPVGSLAWRNQMRERMRDKSKDNSWKP
jgi:hypothetical protein